MVIEQFQFLLRKKGIPKHFGQLDKFKLELFLVFGHLLPRLSLYMLKSKIRQDTEKIVLDQRRGYFRKIVRSRQAAKIALNVNILGETVLGEIEAHNRLKEYLQALERPDVQYLSIKLSNLFSQFHPLGYVRTRKNSDRAAVRALCQSYVRRGARQAEVH